MQEKKKRKFSRKETIAAGVFGVVLLATLVYAAYLVIDSQLFATEVQEAFKVYYAVDPESECSNPAVEYTLLPQEGAIILNPIYPGESQKVCIKVHNLSSEQLPYAVGVVTEGYAGTSENLSFSVDPASGNVAGESDVYSVIMVTADQDSAPGTYQFAVNVFRG